MTETTDAEAAEVLWASSEQGAAAVRAACEKAAALGMVNKDDGLAWAEISAVVYAAYLAAGWDSGVLGDTITRDELDWVLKRHGGRLDAAGLMDEIEANRDSTQYESGAAYQDPEGNLWVFSRALGDDSPHWLRPGLDGSFEYATPRRPLTRLMPAN